MEIIHLLVSGGVCLLKLFSDSIVTKNLFEVRVEIIGRVYEFWVVYTEKGTDTLPAYKNYLCRFQMYPFLEMKRHLFWSYKLYICQS